MTRNSIAKKVRLDKEEHPERYCPVATCLWRLKPGQKCGKHGKAAPVKTEETAHAATA